ncbi:hypothetical protein C7S15_5888 [Burkholderia cepacia]|nr:hypothetical protein [Burkholderia cepacia]
MPDDGRPSGKSTGAACPAKRAGNWKGKVSGNLRRSKERE